MKIAVYTLTHQRDKFIDNRLAEELRIFGHEVDVRNYIYAARESICYEKPDVIIHPMVGGEYKMDTVKKCKEWGVEVVVRRGEAGMGWDQFNQLDENRKKIILGNWDYSPYVDLELVWGEEFADILSEKGHMLRSKIKACGAFAFDPYFPPPKLDRTNKRKTILFATGFSTADAKEDYCETGLPEDSSYHKELHEIHKEARDKWIGAINESVKWFGDSWQFELKVRPGETRKVYTDKVPSCVKIHPEDAPSSEVMKEVDVVVHSGSTLAIEAHLLGIPSFNFCNVNPDPLLAEVCPKVDSYTELEWVLSRVQAVTTINEKVYHELQKHLYGPIDGNACSKAAQYINEHIRHKVIKTNIPNKWPKKVLYPNDEIHLKEEKGDIRWTCPCCRNIFWCQKKVGFYNCVFCNMKIERTQIKQAQSVAK